MAPMFFHAVSSDCVVVVEHNTSATRTDGFKRGLCYNVVYSRGNRVQIEGLAFSHRPMELSESVSVQICSRANYRGCLRIGVSYVDPKAFAGQLPSVYRRNGLGVAGRKEFRGKELELVQIPASECLVGTKLTLTVDVDQGRLLCLVDDDQSPVLLFPLRCPQFWLAFDLHGTCESIRFVNEQETEEVCEEHNSNLSDAQVSACVNHSLAVDVSAPDVGCLTLNDAVGRTEDETLTIPNIRSRPIRYNRDFDVLPLQFHEKCGKNIIFNALVGAEEECIRNFAFRKTDVGFGYVFLSRPLRVDEKILIQIVQVDQTHAGSLAVGLTNCSPMKLKSEDLPLDSDELSKRNEYWMVYKNIRGKLNVDDELVFYYVRNGFSSANFFLKFNRNDPQLIFTMDIGQQLYLFFDLFGSTKSVRLVGALYPKQVEDVPRPPPPRMYQRSNVPHENVKTSQMPQKATGLEEPARAVNVDSRVCQELPHKPKQDLMQQQQQNEDLSHKQQDWSSQTERDYSTLTQDMPTMIHDGSVSAETEECAVCMDRPIGAVFISCGHIATCFECAMKCWTGSGKCPICNAYIKDIVKTFQCHRNK